MQVGVPAGGTLGVARGVMSSLFGGLQWSLDRMLSVAYGVVYDYIFERFAPYQRLHQEVWTLVEAALPAGVDRREVRVLDVACGPGNFTCRLAEAGFTVTGLETYGALVEVAKEKRRVKHLSNVTFRHADLARGNTFKEGAFDQVVNIHSLYVHPTPDQVLREAYRVLKPGGHAVFVNHTRQIGQWSTLREIRKQDGRAAAFRSLLWVLPNSIFEAARMPIGPHYWDENAFAGHLRDAGFTILEMRRTFLNGASLLVWARKGTGE
jgi:ubiquinone/menaquinone biosynthesis C-methylase UbiE